MSMRKGVKELLAEADAEIETIAASDAVKLHGDPNVVFVDLRDIRELNHEGTVPGSQHTPRGMLEFWVDPECDYHKPIFAEDKKFVFFCAVGWRSALAAKAVQDMGLSKVAHVGGGFAAWKEAGGPVAAKDPPKTKS